MRYVSESERNELRYYRKRGISMAIRKRTDSAPEEMLEANRRQLEQLANACGEEAGLHRPLAEVVGGAITGIPEDTDLAQALSDRQTTDLLVQLLDENREQVERALERVREGAYGICEACGRRIPAARLKFQPSATRCVECQSHWDRLNGRTA
jgi:DnaK suppressor protein